MEQNLELYDVTIIGGGPAGLYAAFFSGMRDMKTKLIESREELGGRMLTYPEKIVWDVGGVGPTRASQLTKLMIQQAQTFDPTIVLGQLTSEDWNFTADEKLATNLPGVFVAGDTANYGSKLYLIAGALTDAALAVNSAKQYIEPNAATRVPVSTQNSKFDEKNRVFELLEDSI